MWIWSDILAQRNDSGEALFYVIAVLILSIIGAVFEKFKRKLGEAETEEKKAQPKPRAPARPPVRAERPAIPPARPITRPSPQTRQPRPPQRHRPARVQRPPTQPVPILVEPVIPLAEQPVLQAQTFDKPSPTTQRKTPTARQMRVASIGSLKGLSRQDVRRAIVLNEILGPPLALRDYDRPWER